MQFSMIDKILNELSESSDRIMQVIQEGTSILFDSSSMTTNSHGKVATADYYGIDEQLGMQSSPLNDIANSFMNEVMQGQVGPQNRWENLQAFGAAVNWREPFILSLLAFHILTIVTCYYVRKYGSMASRLVLLGIIAVLVRSAEWINKICYTRWHLFATQNYFDQRGIFASIFFSSPLLLFAFSMLVSYLMEARQLIRELQRMKLQVHKMKREKTQKANTIKKGSTKAGGLKQE